MNADGHRVLIISPVRNEAAHLELVAASVARQSRPPDLWLVVDDGSTDGTLELLSGLTARIPFLRVLSTPPGYTRDVGDRHAVAAAPRAFNWALKTVDWQEFSHVGKLDGDIELPYDYFRDLLAEFDAGPALGVGGGILVERVDRVWRMMRTDERHVRGAVKLYSRECFEAIGGLREQLGWDGIDEAYAQMRGYRTFSFEHIVARHHRACGSVDGVLRGRVRGGETHYIVGFSMPWALAKAVKYAAARPLGVSGAAFLYGYLRAPFRALPAVEDPDYRRFRRAQERRRVMQALGVRS